MIKLLPTSVAVPLSHYKYGPLRQHRWGGSIKPKETLNTACFPYFIECKSLKQDPYIKDSPRTSLFTSKSLTLLCIWKYWMKWTASSITTQTQTVCEHMHTGEGGGKSLYLPPHQGWGRHVGKALWETPPQSRVNEKPVWCNIVPDLFHPFDWAYFSAVRWAVEEFVFTHVCNHTFSSSQLRRRNANFLSII